MVGSTVHSSRRSEFRCQHLCNGSQLSVSLATGDLITSFGFYRPCMNMVYIHTCKENTHIHTKNRMNFKILKAIVRKIRDVLVISLKREI